MFILTFPSFNLSIFTDEDDTTVISEGRKEFPIRKKRGFIKLHYEPL